MIRFIARSCAFFAAAALIADGASAALILERAFFESLAFASVSNTTSADRDNFASDFSELGAGLDVDLNNSASASVTRSRVSDSYSWEPGTATANVTALGAFDGTSIVNAPFSLSTSLPREGIVSQQIPGVRTSSAQAQLTLNVDFRIEGVSEQAPLWGRNITSFSSTVTRWEDWTAEPITFNRLSNLRIYRQAGGGPVGGTLQPGAYTAVGIVSIPRQTGGNEFGNTSWSGAMSLVFDSEVLTAPGFDQSNPLLPFDPQDGQPIDPELAEICGSVTGAFCLPRTPTGTWVDPPLTSGFVFQMLDGATFTDILNFPSGYDGDFKVFVDGILVGVFGPGESVNFNAVRDGGVSAFEIRGISPLADSQDPLAFPLQLAFSDDMASFTMSPVPLPATLPLMAACAVAHW